jgi:hypothetical protein
MSFALIPVRTIALADITGVMVIPWWRAFTFLLVWRFRNRPFAESIVLRLRGDRAPVIISPKAPTEFAKRLAAAAHVGREPV